MKLLSDWLLLLLVVSLMKVECRLPDVTPETHLQREQMKVPSSSVVTPEKKKASRLPGLCRRLKRRRLTLLCHREQFCWRGWGQRGGRGQVCRCPSGSRCSHAFLHSQ